MLEWECVSLKGTGLLGRQTAADPYFGLVRLPLMNLETDDWPREVSRCSGRREEATDTKEIPEEDRNSLQQTGLQYYFQVLSPSLFSSPVKRDKTHGGHLQTLAHYLVVISQHLSSVSAPLRCSLVAWNQTLTIKQWQSL